MKFQEITKVEYKEFLISLDLKEKLVFASIAEVYNKLKKEILYLGIKENNKITAAILIVESNKILGKKEYISPSGILIIENDAKILDFFIFELKKYLKYKNAYLIKVLCNENEGVNLYFSNKKIYKHIKSNVSLKKIKDIKNNYNKEKTKENLKDIILYENKYEELDEFFTHINKNIKENKQFYRELYKTFKENNEVKFISLKEKNNATLAYGIFLLVRPNIICINSNNIKNDNNYKELLKNELIKYGIENKYENYEEYSYKNTIGDKIDIYEIPVTWNMKIYKILNWRK